MNRILVVFFLALGFAGIANAQSDPAPTVAQCQADRSAYLHDLIADQSSITIRTMMGWQQEMFACRKVDVQNENKYYIVATDIIAFLQARQTKFLVRHHLLEEFITEDDGGAR